MHTCNSADLVEAADSQHILLVKRGLMVDPLPDLGAPNLGGGCILHEIVQGYTAHAAQPGLQVLHSDTDVVAQAGLCSATSGHLQSSLTLSAGCSLQCASRQPTLCALSRDQLLIGE